MDLEDITPTAEIVRDLAQQAIAIRQEGRKPDTAAILVVPRDFQHIDLTDTLEKALLNPTRMRGTVQLSSIDSLVQMCKDMDAGEAAYLYADVDARTITAVFNDVRDREPGWRDHRAVFTAELTPEAKRWMGKNGAQNAFGQEAFAEFIEDNIADVAGEEGEKLLRVATTIQATTGIVFSSAKRLQDGQTQLTYAETIDAKAGADGSLQVPKEFTLGLRLFKGDATGYAVKARLKYRLHSGSIKFFYELDRIDRAIEDAFNAYVEKASAETGYIVLHGKP